MFFIQSLQTNKTIFAGDFTWVPCLAWGQGTGPDSLNLPPPSIFYWKQPLRRFSSAERPDIYQQSNCCDKAFAMQMRKHTVHHGRRFFFHQQHSVLQFFDRQGQGFGPKLVSHSDCLLFFIFFLAHCVK